MFSLGFRLAQSAHQAGIHCRSEEADGLGQRKLKLAGKLNGQQFAATEQTRRNPCLRWWPWLSPSSSWLAPSQQPSYQPLEPCAFLRYRLAHIFNLSSTSESQEPTLDDATPSPDARGLNPSHQLMSVAPKAMPPLPALNCLHQVRGYLSKLRFYRFFGTCCCYP